MKKNKILYIFLFVMVSFCFTADVYAAKELTCVYEKGKNKNGEISKVILVQTKNAERFLYKNKDDVSLSDPGWENKTKNGISLDSSIKLAEGNGLTECPKSKSTSTSWFSSKVTFYGDTSGNQALEKQYSSIQSINTLTVNGGSSGNTSNSTCKAKEDWLDKNNKSSSSLRCLYKSSNFSSDHCSVVQLGLSNSADPVVLTSWNDYSVLSTDSSFEAKKIIEITNGDGTCPKLLYVYLKRNYDAGDPNELRLTFSNKNSYTAFQLQENAGYNLVDGEKTDNSDVDFSFEISFTEIPAATTCKELFGSDDDLVDLLSTFINMIKIAVPIILIVLGSLDFAQAVFASNEDGIKKAQQKFIKRLIIAVVIFLIPSVLKLLLTIANEIWGNIDPNLCGLI